MGQKKMRMRTLKEVHIVLMAVVGADHIYTERGSLCWRTFGFYELIDGGWQYQSREHPFADGVVRVGESPNDTLWRGLREFFGIKKGDNIIEEVKSLDHIYVIKENTNASDDLLLRKFFPFKIFLHMGAEIQSSPDVPKDLKAGPEIILRFSPDRKRIYNMIFNLFPKDWETEIRGF